ncbi:hypothetical protein [Microbacterium sp. LMI1-1-1.1]|uniref:hypothetical protein n=1 Tax=Microbacterium sp. LMI1-1-1.1 TaxID=3135223 RepID=UPI003465B4D6
MTPSLNRDGIFVDDDGVKRRTILAGAAWSIPVISVVTAAPAFAATTDLKLAFDKSSYSGEGCKTITGVKVTATRNGVAAAGESVTVTLADGYTFSDGSTSYTATTGSDGSISLPDIKVPGRGGNSTFSATSGSASTNATVSGKPTGQVYASDGSLYGTDQPNSFTSIQTTGKTVWAMDSDKNVWYVNSYDGKWTKVTNATDVTQYSVNGGGATYLKGGKVYNSEGSLYGTDQPGTFSKIQTDGKTVWAIDSDSTLWSVDSYDGKWSKVTGGTNISAYSLNGGGGNYLKDKKVYSSDGQLYGKTQPGTFTSIQTDGATVWAVDSDNTVWSVGSYDGTWAKVKNATSVSGYSVNGGGANFLTANKVYSGDGELYGKSQPGTFTSIQTDGKTVWAIDSDKTIWTVNSYDGTWAKVKNATNVSGFSLDGGGAAFLKPACS